MLSASMLGELETIGPLGVVLYSLQSTRERCHRAAPHYR